MSDVRFPRRKVLTIPQIAKIADYTDRQIRRIVLNPGEFPFHPIERNGKQKRYDDTAKLRQWCSRRREAKIIRAEMARQTSKPYRERHWHYLLKFKESVLWLIQIGALNDQRKIDETLETMAFTIGEVAQRLRGWRNHLHREAELRLGRRETDNLR